MVAKIGMIDFVLFVIFATLLSLHRYSANQIEIGIGIGIGIANPFDTDFDSDFDSDPELRLNFRYGETRHFICKHSIDLGLLPFP